VAVQQHPITGSPGHDAPYLNPPAESTRPIVSEAALEVDQGIAAMQDAARANPTLNGEAARKAGRS
jgi:hypothetical protein